MVYKILFINLLTLIRVIGAFVLIPFYYHFGGLYAGILIALCYFTDSLDGILARHWHASTFFGALFDGVADKLFTIVCYIVLYLITPYALIPIILELLIVLIQLIKYGKNLNIKSNLVGKFKVWILAISIVLIFVLGNININFNIPLSKLYLYLLIPAIIMEILTLLSYIVEIFIPYQDKKIVSQKANNTKKNNTKWLNFKDVWLNPSYYEEHKNDKNIRNIIKITKNK